MLIPDQETAVDYLNYEAVSKTIVALLKENRRRALTIGIHGDWGAGKSSILRMVESEMSDEGDVACLWFNGWVFQGFDDAKTVLIEVIIAELIRQRAAFEKVKKLGRRLLKRLDYMKLAKHGAGVLFTLKTGLPSPMHITTASEALEELTKVVSTLKPDEVEAKLKEMTSILKPAETESVPDDIHHFREDFAELLDEAKIKQLVVLIDDLDRCLPGTAIDTLEAIRLFLFVPKTAFIVGADEGMIEYAVRQHFPNLPIASGSQPYARNYLEKLIQIPFRIPALGTQESRTYVTLLLVEAIVGEEFPGFGKLLEKARQGVNRPWLKSEIALDDVLGVDPNRSKELKTAFVLAHQIGPILAEGTKGNPRQIKRFLNSLMIRHDIANARGFGQEINAAALAKLMLAERFQQDFYDHLASQAMSSADGRAAVLSELETPNQAEASPKERRAPLAGRTGNVNRENDWLSREWLTKWLRIEPALAEIDLRPYVFVARDRRVIVGGPDGNALETLIETLSGGDLAARTVEPQVKELGIADANQVFGGLRDRVLSAPSFMTQPNGFTGLMLVAKHHPRFQTELLGLIEGMDARNLGPWVTKGWAEVLTAAGMTDQLKAQLTRWASQDENMVLRTAATQAQRTRR